MKETDSYKELFMSEAREIFSHLNAALVALEKHPADADLVQEIFRQVHTLKGMAATMGYEEITSRAHALEEMLDLHRRGRGRTNRKTLNHLFTSCDELETWVEKVTQEEKGPGIQTVRVDLQALDHLMNLAGELAINKIRLFQIGQELGHAPLTETLAHLGRLTKELQDRMLEVRLVPMEYIFNRFPRMIRDLAAEEKKDVDLVVEGANIGLDRTILEEISEPLVHLLRNAVGHAIESPEERKQAGKKPRGTIRLTARRERNTVLIDISDDGRGMQAEEIRTTAIQRQLITKEEAHTLSDEESWMLVTLPGFSTSRVVTQTSGRGVGMHTVKAAVESVGGSLTIKSTPDLGTTFTLKLPLTMAIVQSLLVRVGPETFAIPVANVLETIKVNPEQIRQIERHDVVSYRDTVLPLIHLREKFGFTQPDDTNGSWPVVVVEMGHRRAGLITDALVGQQEVVIKMLGGALKATQGVAGATILGDGKVAMIVDVASVL